MKVVAIFSPVENAAPMALQFLIDDFRLVFHVAGWSVHGVPFPTEVIYGNAPGLSNSDSEFLIKRTELFGIQLDTLRKRSEIPLWDIFGVYQQRDLTTWSVAPRDRFMHLRDDPGLQ